MEKKQKKNIKKRKKKRVFRREGSLKKESKNYPMIEKVVNDKHSAYCPTCQVKFSVVNKGKYDLDQHLDTEKHKHRLRVVASSSKIDSHFVKKISSLDEQITAAEATLVYHSVKHHYSFNSVDCTHKLLKTVFPDSNIAGKLHYFSLLANFSLLIVESSKLFRENFLWANED